MTDLIERLEGAEAGSLALDKAILASLGFTWRGMNYWNAANEMWRGPACPTRSLDAALALAERVLPGRKLEILKSDCGGWWAAIEGRKISKKLWDWTGTRAATPALALCAAILRAKGPNPKSSEPEGRDRG